VYLAYRRILNRDEAHVRSTIVHGDFIKEYFYPRNLCRFREIQEEVLDARKCQRVYGLTGIQNLLKALEEIGTHEEIVREFLGLG
jgi:hypothetical protein